MASIERRADGWRVRWRGLDGANRSRQCPDRRTAEKLAADVARAHALGQEWAPALPAPAPPGLTEAAQSWLLSRARVGSPRSVVRQTSEMELFLRWADGEGIATVADMSRSVLERYHAWLQTRRIEHHPAQPATETRPKIRAWSRVAKCSTRSANGRISDLQTWWAWLADHDDYGPLTPPPKRIPLPVAHPRLQTHAPSWTDMDAAILEARTEWHRRAAWVMRCSGLRPGQVVRLRWSDVDLEARTLVVRAELGKSRQEKRGRVVPMAPALAEEIARWPSGAPDTSLTGGPRRWDYGPWAGMWTRSAVPAVRWERSPCMAFRKGFQTGLRRLGAGKDAVERLVGHQVGVSSHYVTDEAAGLLEAVALVPPVRVPGPVRRLQIPRPKE